MSCSIQIRNLTDKEQLVLSLERQYQDDVGVLAALFFNYVKLSPGEALYIGPNEPHAYLSGECIEIMATSDNVVRAGLTPKYRDVQTLCSMLTYKQVSVIVTIVSQFSYTVYFFVYIYLFHKFFTWQVPLSCLLCSQ
jgi:mannose-6-phosphate isomerase class I